MTYKGLDRLGKMISKIPSLERLEIVLNADQPGGNIRLWSLSRSLESLSSLQYLRLCFPYYESSLGDESLDIIFLKDCMKKLKELRSLSLEFPRCEKIKDFWFEEICDGINELGLLEHLKLEFSFCTNISNESLKVLGPALGRLRSLKIMFLNLLNCRNMEESGLDEIHKGLGKLKKIENVSISASGCWHLNQQILKRFEENLMTHPNIKNVNIF